MELCVNNSNKIVEIWLNRQEKLSKQPLLVSYYKKYSADGYTVVVFESGEHDLYESTRNLLLLNREHLSAKC